METYVLLNFFSFRKPHAISACSFRNRPSGRPCTCLPSGRPSGRPCFYVPYKNRKHHRLLGVVDSSLRLCKKRSRSLPTISFFVSVTYRTIPPTKLIRIHAQADCIHFPPSPFFFSLNMEIIIALAAIFSTAKIAPNG